MGYSTRYPRVPVLRTFRAIRRSPYHAACPRIQSGVLPHSRLLYNSANDPNFSSLVDNAPDIVRSGKRHGPGIIILGSAARFMLPNDELTIYQH